MGDRDEEEELQMALRMSLHGSPPAQPDPKRSKPPSLPAGGESPEAAARRKQRDLMAAAAEKRLRSLPSPQPAALVSPSPPTVAPEAAKVEPELAAVPMAMEDVKEAGMAVEVETEGEELPPDVAEKLWVMVFGIGVSKAVLAQWTNQGIR
jgi:hypothetical protein